MQQAGVEVPEDYSVRVRSVRGCIELTQAQLAKRIGVSFATVNRWENGQSKPTRLAWQQILDLEAEFAAAEGSSGLAADPAETPSPRLTGGQGFSPTFAEDRSREIAATVRGAVQQRLAQLLGS